MVKVIIKKSDKSDKKYVAIFTRDNGRKKSTHFGSSGMNDYTITGDKERRRLYRNRHKFYGILQTKSPSVRSKDALQAL